MRRNLWLGIAALGLLAVGGILVISRGSGLPFVEREQVWGVGIYSGDGPLTVDDISLNPVVTGANFDDPRIRGVADPWLVIDNGRWFLFYEVVVRDTSAPNNQHAVLAVSTSTDHGVSWAYQGVVLEEPWHLSWPQVFEHAGDYYMVPESLQAGEIVLYRAEDFPMVWHREATLLVGEYTDPTIFLSDGRWWLLATESIEAPDDTLRLFHSEEMAGPYLEHQASPIVTSDISKARSAGPVVATSDRLLRFAQDHSEGYGHSVRAFEITTLNVSAYSEEEVSPSPVLTGSGEGWNSDGMHHLVPVQTEDGSWIAAVDGFYYRWVFGLDR